MFDMLRSDDDQRLAMGELNVWRKRLYRKQITQKQCVVVVLPGWWVGGGSLALPSLVSLLHALHHRPTIAPSSQFAHAFHLPTLHRLSHRCLRAI
jgi:hypothetical protein